MLVNTHLGLREIARVLAALHSILNPRVSLVGGQRPTRKGYFIPKLAKTLDKDTARAPLIDFKGKNAKIAPMLQCNVAQTAISADNGPAKPYRMRVSEDRVVLTGFHERDWVKLGKDFPTMCGVVLTGFHERDWVKLGKDFPTMCGVVLTGFHERDWVAGWACRRRQKILAGGCRFNQVKAGGLYGRKRSTPDTPAAE